MKFIANILTNKKFDNCEFYNIVSKKEDLIDNIPTLVIGWEFTKALYPNANITTWEIDDKTYWTFGNRERRQRYEENLKKFMDLALNKLVKSINYKYINVSKESKYGEETALEFLLNNFIDINIYINNDMVYVSGKKGVVVYGFSLRDYEYLGYDKKNIFKKIYESNVNIIKASDIESWELKTGLSNRNYVIPCLY